VEEFSSKGPNCSEQLAKPRDRVCKVIVDSGSMDNLISTEMVEKARYRDN
jgi:hypothetical protein